jgi:predicted TIM-barrel fold metal-dependent hydrolase
VWFRTETAADVPAHQAAFPHTPIVPTHTGFPWDRSEPGPAAWRRATTAIARQPDGYLQVSEFGLRDQP